MVRYKVKQKNTFEGKAFRVLFIVLADLFIVFSVIIIGYDSVFSPEFPVSIGAFFLILLLWLNVEMVVQYFWRGKRRSRILKKYKVTQFTQHVLFEENDIKITNNVNAECYVIPYNQVVRVRRKKNLLLFFAKDYHLIAVDQSVIPFGGQNELFHSIFEKMPQAARWGIK